MKAGVNEKVQLGFTVNDTSNKWGGEERAPRGSFRGGRKPRGGYRGGYRGGEGRGRGDGGYRRGGYRPDFKESDFPGLD